MDITSHNGVVTDRTYSGDFLTKEGLETLIECAEDSLTNQVSDPETLARTLLSVLKVIYENQS